MNGKKTKNKDFCITFYGVEKINEAIKRDRQF